MLDEYYMKLALDLAKGALGQTSPNPPVGAVVVKDGAIAGVGAHLKAGEPHAEVHALQMAGDKAQGATIYVTLEPCSHFGKTPPCADLVIASGIKRAVVAVTDANELVAGSGIRKLQEAGIEVTVGVLKEEAEEVNRVFFHYARTKKPFVTVKAAMSLDGKTAAYTGDSKWITSGEARLDVHLDRSRHDAILVGVNTVLEDDASLTVRLPNGSGRNPLRVILDTDLRTPPGAKVAADGQADTWIFTGNQVPVERLAAFEQNSQTTVIQLPDPAVRIEAVLAYLGGQGIMSLYVEGGSTVNASFLEAGQINEAILYYAPKLIGGKLAPTSFSGSGFANVGDSLQLEIRAFEKIGPDLKITAVPKRRIT